MKKEEQAPGTERVSVTLVVDFAGFGKTADVRVEGCPTEGFRRRRSNSAFASSAPCWQDSRRSSAQRGGGNETRQKGGLTP